MNRMLMATTVPETLRAFLLPFADHFTRLGWTVDAMARGASSSEECRRHFGTVHDVDWSRNPLDPRNLSAAIDRVRRVVEAGEYDLVHVHTPVAGFVTRMALRHLRDLGRPKVVYSAHGFHFHRGGHPMTNLAYRCLERMAGRWTDGLIVLNDEDFEAARRLKIVPEGRLHLVPGIGVDTKASVPTRSRRKRSRRSDPSWGWPTATRCSSAWPSSSRGRGMRI